MIFHNEMAKYNSMKLIFVWSFWIQYKAIYRQIFARFNLHPLVNKPEKLHFDFKIDLSVITVHWDAELIFTALH